MRLGTDRNVDAEGRWLKSSDIEKQEKVLDMLLP